jgi:hypothetical protein
MLRHKGLDRITNNGRFTLEQISTKLAAYAAANRRKKKLIDRSLKFLKTCEVNRGGAVLVLVDPVVKDEMIDWICLDSNKVPDDEREAILTGRILAGYLPICCLVEDESLQSGWRPVVDANLVPKEYRDEFIAFARSEADLVALEFKGALSGDETTVMVMPWKERSYPGVPVEMGGDAIAI